MLSTVTRQAPSLSLQTFQEISGETPLLQAQGFQWSPLAPASPDPRRLRDREGPDGEGRLAEQPGPAGAQERPGKMLLKSQEQRCSPQVAGHLSPRAVSGEIPAGSGPPKGASPVATSATPVPKRQPCWGVGGGRRLYFPCSLTFSKNFPSLSSTGREKPRRPGRLSHPTGRAAPGGNSPPARRSVLRLGLKGSAQRAPRRGCSGSWGRSWSSGSARRDARARLSGAPDGSGPGGCKHGSEPEARALALNW